MSPFIEAQKIRVGTLVRCNDPMPADRYIAQIMPHGFECFGLFFWATCEVFDWDGQAEAVTRTLEGTGTVISSLGFYGNPVADPSQIAYVQACIDNARRFGTDLITGFTGRPVDVPIDKGMPEIARVWKPLLQRAADQGVRIAFENCQMGGDWNRGDWNAAHSPDAWELLFEALPYENMGLCWEPCHQMVALIDPLEELKEWVPRVFSVHGKDATIHWDIIRKYGIYGPRQFVYHRTPGFGDSNWTDIISVLRASGFEGNIEIEGWHDPVYRDELEMTGQVHALNYLKQCRGGDFVANPS